MKFIGAALFLVSFLRHVSIPFPVRSKGFNYTHIADIPRYGGLRDAETLLNQFIDQNFLLVDIVLEIISKFSVVSDFVTLVLCNPPPVHFLSQFFEKAILNVGKKFNLIF